MHPFVELWVETAQPHRYRPTRNSSSLVLRFSILPSLQILSWPLNPLLGLQEALRRRPGQGRRGRRRGRAAPLEERGDGRGGRPRVGTVEEREGDSRVSAGASSIIQQRGVQPQLTPVAWLVTCREMAFKGLWQSQEPAALRWQVASLLEMGM